MLNFGCNNSNFIKLLSESFYLEPLLKGDLTHQAELLSLRQDMTTLLSFVEENKVVGTQSTGNMPLKMIRQLTSNFVNPPKLEHKIGDRIYKIRSESEVWQLYFLHILAEVGNLLKIAPSKQWRLKPAGRKFLNVPPLNQVLYLLMIWWYRVNWLVAYQIAGIGEKLPNNFEIITLESLTNIPANTRASFEEFADLLIQKTGLRWTASDSTFVRKFLYSSIEKIVIDILATFGMIEQEYLDEPLGKAKIPKLVSFKITSYGVALLKANKMIVID